MLIQRLFTPCQEQSYVRKWCGFLPRSDPSRGLWQVQGRIIWDLDGLLHGSQQTLASLSPQGRAKTLWTSDQQFHHHVSIFLYTLTWYRNTSSKGTEFNKVKIKLFIKRQGRVSCRAETLDLMSSSFQNYYFICLFSESHISTWAFSSLGNWAVLQLQATADGGKRQLSHCVTSKFSGQLWNFLQSCLHLSTYNFSNHVAHPTLSSIPRKHNNCIFITQIFHSSLLQLYYLLQHIAVAVVKVTYRAYDTNKTWIYLVASL